MVIKAKHKILEKNKKRKIKKYKIEAYERMQIYEPQQTEKQICGEKRKQFSTKSQRLNEANGIPTKKANEIKRAFKTGTTQ